MSRTPEQFKAEMESWIDGLNELPEEYATKEQQLIHVVCVLVEQVNELNNEIETLKQSKADDTFVGGPLA